MYHQQVKRGEPSDLLSIDEAMPTVLVPVLGHQYNTDMGMLEGVQQRAIKMTKGLEHLSCEQRLRAGAVQPWKEEAQAISSMFINT